MITPTITPWPIKRKRKVGVMPLQVFGLLIYLQPRSLGLEFYREPETGGL